MEFIQTIHNELANKNHLAIWVDFIPSDLLLSDIKTHYPNAWIDWVCVNNHDFSENHLLHNIRNSRGLSYFPISDKQRLWLFSGSLNELGEYWGNRKLLYLAKNHSPDLLPYIQKKPNGLSEIILPNNYQAIKEWFSLPENPVIPKTVAIIGGGIAAAATAFACASRGLQVIVLEKDTIASQGSGNRQGLLYAKISPHDTMQSRLLLQSYGFSRQLLELYLDKQFWQNCGVVHLDFNDEEKKRNQLLSQQKCGLYHYLTPDELSQIAGIDFNIGGLFWQNGGWIHPPQLVKQLFTHPNIQVIEHTELLDFHYQNNAWQLFTNTQKNYCADSVVFCTGANKNIMAKLGLTIFQIRGQTDNVLANHFSGSLNIALSGQSYISPAWQNAHCFGATFSPNNADTQISAQDSSENRQNLIKLHTQLGEELGGEKALPPHCAIRADAYDHLPLIGRVGNYLKMKEIYAPLAKDKNFHFKNTPKCPYLPNVFVNVAHSSRGLATAPLCGEALACEMLGLPNPLGETLRVALSPNRVIIRDLIHHKLL
ncbi:MAG: FAD-dependent 5-carboxymethylaminomethyl-2-thiouridine(34) oxidoreductase MnmC [Neisseriaceae bacterium]|nr:FAD-dependent 5-carboxymethylaminomethyl-2-thiouridine(34) oxidoreductase MnmC [Neisseriaceae bacterium]